jgi:hypothetical protein
VWGHEDRSIGYAWRNRNDEFGRGTEFEIPEAVFPHLVAFAIKRGYLTWPALVNAAHQLDEDVEN